MPNNKQSAKTAVLLVAISLAMMLATGRCLGDNGDIDAYLQPNLDVGVAFPPSMGPSPKFSPQGDYFDVTVTLWSPGGYYIIGDDTTSSYWDGATIWKCTSGSTGSVESQTWEGTGWMLEDDWADVFFSGNLTTTGGSNGSPPPFWASVADISIYVDALGLHSDEPNSHHWPPQVGLTGFFYLQQEAETEGGGFYLPPAIITTGTSGFPSSLLPTGSNYKTLILRLKTPTWIASLVPMATLGTCLSVLRRELPFMT